MRKILVVEDDKTVSDLIIEVLRDQAQCVCVSNSTEGLKVFERANEAKNKFDFVFIDVSSQDRSGLDFLQRIRTVEKNLTYKSVQATKVFIITAHREPFIEAFNEGCDEYILKPIDPEHLLTKINQHTVRPDWNL